MEEKNPIPYNILTEYDYSEMEPCIKAVPRKKKRKRNASFFKAVFYIFVCLALALLIYVNYDRLRAFTDNLLFGAQNSDTGSQNSDVPADTDTVSDNKKDDNTSFDTQSDNDEKDEKDEKDELYAIIPMDMSGGILDNQTSLKFNTSKLTFTKKKLPEIYTEYGKSAPIVLIIHSCSDECYSDGVQYSENAAFYSDAKNVSDIGEIISSVLSKQGINCIHIKDNFAEGSIYSSKEKYDEVLSNTLKKYPSIVYVIDVSRDVTIDGDMTMLKPTVSISDTSYAQLKISVGSNEVTKNPYWSANLAFALSLSEYISKSANNLMRPCVLSRFALSQQYAPLSIKIDVGSYSNTYEEASASAELFAYILSSYIKE